MNYGFKPHVIHVADHFQFGSGGIHKAAKRAYLPAALPGRLAEGLLLRVSVLKDAQIPFLASNTMLEKLGCVVDTVRQRLRFEFIGDDVPLERLYVHYVVNLTSFSKIACKSDVWKNLYSDDVWNQPDPEVTIAATLAQDPDRHSQPDVLHQRASGMASAMEELGAACHDPVSGMAPRVWLTMLEQHIISLEDHATRASRTRPHPTMCSHPFRRYGNRAGRFSQCLQCLQRFSDELHAWVIYGGPPSQRSEPRDLPPRPRLLQRP